MFMLLHDFILSQTIGRKHVPLFCLVNCLININLNKNPPNHIELHDFVLYVDSIEYPVVWSL